MRRRLVLALDGSTGICSAALLGPRTSRSRTGEPSAMSAVEMRADESRALALLARRSEGDGRAHARVLLRLVDEILEEAGCRPQDLGAVVVGKGPGTFTGVRVTVATARALGLSLAIPVFGVSTLSALAAAAADSLAKHCSTADEDPAAFASEDELETVLPVVDARRGQLFYGVYRPSTPGRSAAAPHWTRRNEFAVCDRAGLAEVLERPRTVIVGEEALSPEKLPSGSVFVSREVAAEHLVIGQEHLEEPGRLPEGGRLAASLERALADDQAAPAVGLGHGAVGGLGTPESVTPIYVRSPDADVHITRMKDPWADGSAGC